MTELAWSEVRQGAIRAFAGELPKSDTEQQVIDAFEVNPVAVTSAISRVAERFAQGKVRSPWAILRRELQAAGQPLREALVETADSRSDAVAKAERWIRTVGVHYDRPAEVLAELFEGQFTKNTTLRPWADDDALKGRLLELWREVRPGGEQVEREELERAQDWKRQRTLVGAGVVTEGGSE